MLLQIKKNKKGVSAVVGYVLLISLAVVMGGVVYLWIKSYVPQESVECPEGSSLTLESYSYNCSTNSLEIKLRNDGRFNIGGYQIKAGTNPNQTIATIDLSGVFVNTKGLSPPTFENAVLLGEFNNNSLQPTQTINNSFDLSGMTGNITALEIIPTRWQREDNQVRFVSCGEVSKIEELISCG